MLSIDRHLPGEFCWIELATGDQDAAKTFYGSLFGWTASDMPIRGNDFYTMFQLDGCKVGGAYSLRPEQRAQDVPPHWMLYVSVKSANDAASRTAQLGGKVCDPAFDVFDAGRMAVLQDPAGAIFSVWEAKKHHGTAIESVPGTFCWADLSTPDPQRSSRFYSDLFGWKFAAAEHDSSGYLHIQSGEKVIGGVPPVGDRSPKIPSHWLAYFFVSDCDQSAAKAQQLEATFLAPPKRLENVGHWAILADPQGAIFAIFQPPRHS